MKKLLYWDWIRHEANRIGSDGCTVVSEYCRDACLQHDLCYKYQRNPRSAYTRYVKNLRHKWMEADPISREEADRQFRDTLQSLSPLGRWSPVSWIRWAGVRIFGRIYWKDSHV
jgi:protein-S-isoprenylcysteine O-methyltransferase Ste14